jgi:hypothetical protein
MRPQTDSDEEVHDSDADVITLDDTVDDDDVVVISPPDESNTFQKSVSEYKDRITNMKADIERRLARLSGGSLQDQRADLTIRGWPEWNGKMGIRGDFEARSYD